MRMKSIFFLVVLSVCLLRAEAQQIFTTSQFMEHNLLYNPATAGANDYASVGAIYRTMWEGIDGGPKTTILFGDNYFAKKNTGLSVVLYDDKTGPTSRTGGHINLSYSINLKEGKRLMFGLGGQVMQYKIDKSEMTHSLSYTGVSDPLLAGPGSVVKGDASAGIYLKTPTINIGFSVQQLVGAKLDFIKGTTNPEGKLYSHYYLMANYNLKTDEDNVLIPNFLFQYRPDAPADFSGGVKLEHKDLLWIGFNYHYKQSFSAYAGLKIHHKFAIGYAFDQYTSPLGYFDQGSTAHEFSLRYFFNYLGDGKKSK